MIIRNAHNGAAGNQAIWAIALTATKKTAAHRAEDLPEQEPDPGEHEDDAEDQLHPTPGRHVGDDHSVPADDDYFVVEDRRQPIEGVK